MSVSKEAFLSEFETAMEMMLDSVELGKDWRDNRPPPCLLAGVHHVASDAKTVAKTTDCSSKNSFFVNTESKPKFPISVVDTLDLR